jgi:hypothetical protein
MSVHLWRLAGRAEHGGWPPRFFWRWLARRLGHGPTAPAPDVATLLAGHGRRTCVYHRTAGGAAEKEAVT